jgi:hypothetical protein
MPHMWKSSDCHCDIGGVSRVQNQYSSSLSRMTDGLGGVLGVQD